MTRTFALIAPVQPVLHQASCSKETIQNAPKHYEIQQYMNLGSNGVGRLHSLRKIPNRLHGTNLCINCTCLSHFAPRRTKTIVKGPMEWVGCIRCEKFQNDFMAQTCALIELVQPVLQRVSCSKETLPNAPKHYETHQNMSLGSNGVDRFLSLRKIPMRLRGTNFCISCTSSSRFVSSIVQ